jgi:Mg/Co/Ni transporter MgtE
MASDDAADLLLELDQERRIPILNLLPPAKQHKIRSLLGHNPQTAGGMMNPDFISVPARAAVADALARVRSSELGPQQVSTVCVVDEQGRLVGAPSLAELLRAGEKRPVSSLTEGTLPTVVADADLPEVATVMTDYNLVAIPVIDDNGSPVGIIAVDDVLEMLLPEEWRWRAGAARD